jgi:hypothetical protein
VKGDVVPKLQELATALMQIANAKLTDLAPTFDKLKVSIGGIDMKTFANGWSTLVSAVQPIITMLTPFVDRILKDLKTQFDSVVTALKPLGDALGQLLAAFKPLEPLIKPLAEAIGVVLVGAMIAILVEIDLFVKAMTITMVGAIDVVTALINDVLTPVVKGIVDAFTYVVTQLATYVPQFLQKGTDLITGLLKGITDKFFDVTHWFEDMGSKIENAIGDTASTLFDAGENLVTGLFSGITSAFESGIGAVTSKLNPKNWDIPGLSPLPVAMTHAGQIAGTNFGTGLSDALIKMLPVVQSAANKALGALLPGNTAGQTMIAGNAAFAAGGALNNSSYDSFGLTGAASQVNNANLYGGMVGDVKVKGAYQTASDALAAVYAAGAPTGAAPVTNHYNTFAPQITVQGNADETVLNTALDKWWTHQTTIAAVQANA